MSARSIGSGTIALASVVIPVKLYTATSPKAVSFNLLHSCGSRVGQMLTCKAEDKPIERAETVRAFELAADQFVTFTDEEVKALEASRPPVLQIRECVPATSLDPLFVEKSVYLAPDKGGVRGYRLLAEALERARVVAIGTFAQRGKDVLVALRPYRGGLAVHEVFYADEVRSFDELDHGGDVTLTRRELELAAAVVRGLRREAFDPSRFRDEWAAKVRDAAEAKLARGAIAISPATAPPATSDLAAALERSIAELGSDRPARSRTQRVAKGKRRTKAAKAA